MIKFVKPTEEMLRSIAADMRKEDAAEVWASNHSTPLEALMGGWHASDFSTVVESEGKPLVIIGLVKRDLLTGSGIVWMLGTNEALKHKREFVRQTFPVITELLTICPRLCNMVHSKNTKSIRWLRVLGFKIEPPIQHGPDGELFHPFSIERG